MKSRKNGHYSVKNGLPITYYRAKRCNAAITGVIFITGDVAGLGFPGR